VNEPPPRPTTRQKALAVNLDPRSYGTIAEIGAGQEVARWFFHVGGAAATVAKTISAYDMAVSDALYGPGQRYVSRQRLEAMLDHEFGEIVERLGGARGDTTAFFAFADTAATRRYGHAETGHGWLGIRFQARPGEAPSEVLIYAELFDSTAVMQQEALGVLGVNLVHAALFHHADPATLIAGLLDDLGRVRAEVGMIKFSGAAFAGVDNRLMSLQLVEQGLTDVAMFTAAGEVVQPAEVLHHRPVLVVRGHFRPVTRRTLDIVERSGAQFRREPAVDGQEPLVLMEMTLRSLTSGAGVDHADFLARADILGELGVNILISRFTEYYRLAEYLVGATTGMIGIGLDLLSLRELADEQHFRELPGGIIESTGRLFKRSVKMFVYPTRNPATGEVYTLDGAPVPPPWNYLRDLLVHLGRIEPIREYSAECLSISGPDVLARIQRGDPSWEALVPAPAVQTIKAKGLFGYTPGADDPRGAISTPAAPAPSGRPRHGGQP
jgi:hypothetical protein